MPTYSANPGVDWGQVAQAVSLRRNLEAADETAKANAIRWQGQQDYQTLIGSGVDPSEALRRTAHKLYFNSPAGMASALRATQQKPQWDPSSGVTADGIRYLKTSPNSAVRLNEAPEEPREVIIAGKPFALYKNSLHPVTTSENKPMTESERLRFISKIPELMNAAQDYDKNSPEWEATTNATAQIKAALAPRGITPPAPRAP